MVAKTMDQLVSLCKRRGFIFRMPISTAACRGFMTMVR